MVTNTRGDPIKPDRLGELFHRLVREADLPPIRLHDLRHGAASLSLAAGNDLKTVPPTTDDSPADPSEQKHEKRGQGRPAWIDIT